MDSRYIIPVALLLVLALVPALDGADAAPHPGGEGHGEGIDVVYTTGERCIAVVTLDRLPSGDVTLSFISLTDGQSVGPVEAAKVLAVFVTPLVMEDYTVLVTMHDTGEVFAECQITITNTLTVAFDSDGGKGYIPPREVQQGSKITLPESTFTPPEGKNFLYWSVGQQSYQPGSEITVSDNTTVKAVWSDKVCKITFLPGDAKGQMDPVNVNSGESYVIPSPTFTPPEGKNFKYWDCNGTHYSSGQSVTVYNDMQLTAVYGSEDSSMLYIAIAIGAIVIVLLIVVFLLFRRKHY